VTLTGLSFAYLRDRALNTGLNVLLLASLPASVALAKAQSSQYHPNDCHHPCNM
jgi:hypothetical protein